MEPKQLDLLTKFMMLTSSESDGEALNALRRANALLKKNNLVWAEFLSSRTTPRARASQRTYEPPPRNDPPPTDAAAWAATMDLRNAVFKPLLRILVGGPRDFIDSLYTQWNDWGNLTPKQWAALRKFYFTNKYRF